VLEKMHPRLLGAQKLVEERAVRLDDDSAYVRSGDVEYLVRDERCTCPWFARHRGERGPCKHVLAVQQVRREVSVGSRR
jgi:predicted nucleic acid-binding Zn finger protein